MLPKTDKQWDERDEDLAYLDRFADATAKQIIDLMTACSGARISQVDIYHACRDEAREVDRANDGSPDLEQLLYSVECYLTKLSLIRRKVTP